MINYKTLNKGNDVTVHYSAHVPAKGVSEYQVIIQVTNPTFPYERQLHLILNAFAELKENELKETTPVFKRYFLSDAANQTDKLLAAETKHPDCALSIIEQAPCNGTKIALWASLYTMITVRPLSNGMFEAVHNGYRHWWKAGDFNYAAHSEDQTRLLLNDYVTQLAEQGCTLAGNCIRTWFFVQNIDVNYAGMVKARNEVFLTQNLTEKTHYIASTGIGGRHADPKVRVQMDAYAIDGLATGQIQYLYAATHLNPTYEYGVSFERGTCVKYGDRRQAFISGTASINNKGEVVYAGDICRQTRRMWENVEALLKEAELTFNDVTQAIVYLRDPSDYTLVKELFEQKFPNLPRVIVHAPVCRPQWLVEMECMAVKADKNDTYNDF